MTTNEAPRASEGQHWYAIDGTPVYEVPNAKGTAMRKATLADARKINLGPGVTSILQVRARPELVRWQKEQAVMAALTLPRMAGEDDAAFVARVLDDSEETARTARDTGTEIHAAIEASFGGVTVAEEYHPHVAAVHELIAKTCGVREWHTEKPVAHYLGFGTKVDLFTKDWVIDFKGKDFTDTEFSKCNTYVDHWMQLAATREALAEARLCDFDAKCAIIFVSRNTPGVVFCATVDQTKLDKGWRLFKHCLNLWQTEKDFYPDWDREEVAK